MDGRTQRRRLTHRAIAKPFVADQYRPENHRHRDAGHDVVEIQYVALADPAAPPPRIVAIGRLVKGMRLGGRVAGGRDGDRFQPAVVQGFLDRGEADVPAQERPQGGVVEQRLGHADEAARHDGCEPVQAALQHRQLVGPEDLVAAEVAPHLFQFGDRQPETARFGGNDDSVHGPGRGAAQDIERIHGTFRQLLRNCFEDPDLKCATRAAAREHQRSFRISRIRTHELRSDAARTRFPARNAGRIIVGLPSTQYPGRIR